MSMFDFPASGDPPWAHMPHSYAGWVPTISGHLSFSLIGSRELGLDGCRSFNRQTSDGARRVVAVLQRRAAQDSIITRRILKYFRPEIEQDFLLIGCSGQAITPYFRGDTLKSSTDGQGVLAGLLVVIPHDAEKNNENARNKLLDDIRAVLDDETHAAESVPDRLVNLLDQAKIATHTVGSYRMSFALFRTGEFRLWFDMPQFLQSNVYAQAVEQGIMEAETARILPSQSYFFVKDVAHLHYHHEPHSDQLLPLVQLKAPSSLTSVDTNEHDWRRDTLWGLARVVAQFRRQGRINDYKKALGILAYADAFQSTLARVRRQPKLETGFDEKTNLSTYDFAHLRASVEAMEGLAEWRRSGGLQAYAILAGVFFSGATLWTAAVQIRPIICPVAGTDAPTGQRMCLPYANDSAVDLSLWVAQHPGLFVSSVFFLGVTLFTLIFWDPALIPGRKLFLSLLSRITKAIGVSVARRVQKSARRGADYAGWIAALATLSAGLAGSATFALWTLGALPTVRDWILGGLSWVWHLVV
ncbi:hypothetical protein [Sphingomonas crocodyli]|uniref:Uncharacterized protein n=1 Tax=Sphingomonas crocodyli TaxID=1979270 RepID=A0A437M5H5_9SPHN|nr:hypothetical protein [Sphingomonas crocodyli]RVT92971.1 hypothetical protein EOD43_03435 [Sphingomonas crocodyli]